MASIGTLSSRLSTVAPGRLQLLVSWRPQITYRWPISTVLSIATQGQAVSGSANKPWALSIQCHPWLPSQRRHDLSVWSARLWRHFGHVFHAFPLQAAEKEHSIINLSLWSFTAQFALLATLYIRLPLLEADPALCHAQPPQGSSGASICRHVPFPMPIASGRCVSSTPRQPFSTFLQPGPSAR